MTRADSTSSLQAASVGQERYRRIAGASTSVARIVRHYRRAENYG